jgi:hypothetical protein
LCYWTHSPTSVVSQNEVDKINRFYICIFINGETHELSFQHFRFPLFCLGIRRMYDGVPNSFRTWWLESKFKRAKKFLKWGLSKALNETPLVKQNRPRCCSSNMKLSKFRLLVWIGPALVFEFKSTESSVLLEEVTMKLTQGFCCRNELLDQHQHKRDSCPCPRSFEFEVINFTFESPIFSLLITNCDVLLPVGF